MPSIIYKGNNYSSGGGNTEGGSSTLAGLSDVDISNPTDGQILQYDVVSQKWVNGISLPVPVGSTVTPTDDIQTWLNCAGIFNKTSYTTISDVLSDTTTLLALISSNNAADYMKRSTTWVSDVTANSTAMTDIGSNDYCADVLLNDSTWSSAIRNSAYYQSVLNVIVPTMTSNTTPSGECYGHKTASQLFESNFYYAFKGDTSAYGGFESPSGFYSNIDGTYIGYKFIQPVRVCKAQGTVNYATGTSGVTEIIASNDQSTWTVLAEVNTSHVTAFTADFDNANKYLYYAFRVKSVVSNPHIFMMSNSNFYGRA